MAQTLSDAFAGTLTDSWNVVGSAANTGGVLQLQSSSYVTDLVTHKTACDTVVQYIKAQWLAYTGYPALVLRFTNSSSPYYAFGIDSGPVLKWLYYSSRGADETQIGGNMSLAWDVGVYVGITIVGTGDSTVVRVWLDPTGDAPDTDGATWGSASPAGSWTDNPGASAVDTGSYIGFAGAGSSANYASFDNFTGGDVPAGGGASIGGALNVHVRKAL